MLKRLFSLISVFVLLASPAFAGSYKVEDLFSSTAVASTGTATSKVLNVSNGGYFGFHYQALSTSSTPDVKIEFLMASSCDAADSAFVVPSGASNIETNLVSENWVVKSFAPPPMKCMKIKVTGNAGNPSDTLFTGKLFIQES